MVVHMVSHQKLANGIRLACFFHAQMHYIIIKNYQPSKPKPYISRKCKEKRARNSTASLETTSQSFSTSIDLHALCSLTCFKKNHTYYKVDLVKKIPSGMHCKTRKKHHQNLLPLYPTMEFESKHIPMGLQGVRSYRETTSSTSSILLQSTNYAKCMYKCMGGLYFEVQFVRTSISKNSTDTC